MGARRIMRTAAVLSCLGVVGGLVVLGSAGPALAGGSCHAPSTSATGLKVELNGLCFGPTVLFAKVGATVTWTNRDPFEHTMTGLGGSWGSFESLGQNRSASYRFGEPGVYPYACILHPGMVGAVVVGDVSSLSKTASAQSAVVPVTGPAGTSGGAAKAAGHAGPAAGGGSTWSWAVALLAVAGIALGALATLSVRRVRDRKIGIPA